MIIREYISNPMGKGDSSIPNRKEMIGILDTKYDRLVHSKGNDIKMDIYKAGNKTDDIYFHLVIPTETERTNSYDVVFCFSDSKRQHRNELSISNYDVTVFANSPSFAYTFAYVYEKNGLFVTSLKRKLGKEFFKNAPEVRNKYEIINYEKYVYFGAKFIIGSKRLNKAFLDMIAKKYHPEFFERRIRTLETIMAEYKKAETKRKRKDKQGTTPPRPMGGNRSVLGSRVKEVKKKSTKPKSVIKASKVRKI